MSGHFDAIVIGTGQAGPYLASRLAGAGMKVAVVERPRAVHIHPTVSELVPTMLGDLYAM